MIVSLSELSSNQVHLERKHDVRLLCSEVGSSEGHLNAAPTRHLRQIHSDLSTLDVLGWGGYRVAGFHRAYIRRRGAPVKASAVLAG